MSDGSHPREVVFDNLRSGVTTDSMLARELAALRVSWIAWDSGFRGSGLQIGDEIIAVNGENLAMRQKSGPFKEFEELLSLGAFCAS